MKPTVHNTDNSMELRTITVPTGKIIVMNGEFGRLECLSLGDYGKDRNIKADFLGVTREINGVPSGDVMPLKKKWVITLSTQYGCSMGCRFCDVPKVGPGRNASLTDLNHQLAASILMGGCFETDRLNIHYARMGEPTFNEDVILHAQALREVVPMFIKARVIHPVLSTMLPNRNKHLKDYLRRWCLVKNRVYRGDAGLQFSINSTNEQQRQQMFCGNSLSLLDIRDLGSCLPMPVGRKYALNFALADGYEVDADKLAMLFSPDKFMVKITPMHLTRACLEGGIVTSGGYDEYSPYKEAEKNLKSVGFDVLVFVPSREEDEGMITCGNAVLAGHSPNNTVQDSAISVRG